MTATQPSDRRIPRPSAEDVLELVMTCAGTATMLILLAVLVVDVLS